MNFEDMAYLKRITFFLVIARGTVNLKNQAGKKGKFMLFHQMHYNLF